MKLVALLFAAALTARAAAAPSPGDAAFARGDFDEAFAAYSKALSSAPRDGNALLGLGTLEAYRGDLVGARRDLSLAQALLPGDPRVAARLRALDRASAGPGTLRASISGGEVDVPFLMTDPLPMIVAKVNGHDAKLLIDTGAPTLVLSARAASRFGVAMHPVGEGVFLGGRRASISEGTVDTLTLGAATVRSVPTQQLPALAPTSMGGRAYDGIVGTTLLRQFLATIDYSRGRLVLRPRDASSAFEAAAASSGASIVPMWLVPDHFIFARARVNGYDALFSVDTGLAGGGLTLTASALDAAHIAPDEAKASTGYGGGGAVRTIPFTAESVALGTFVQRRVPGVYVPGGDPYGVFPFAVAGAISHAFFRGAAVTFDFKAMKLIVQKDRFVTRAHRAA